MKNVPQKPEAIVFLLPDRGPDVKKTLLQTENSLSSHRKSCQNDIAAADY